MTLRVLKHIVFVLFSSNSARYVAGRQDVLQYSHSKGYEQTKAPKLNKTKKKGETNHGSPR